MPNEFKSEIIRQKKQFILNVEQSSNYVFPKEEYTYLVYIKNISTQDIENFNIKIEAPEEVLIKKKTVEEDTSFTLKKGEAKLYKFEASIDIKGEYLVHFIGYGSNSQIIHKTLKIKCSRSYNSDKLIHKIHIYDFTPYENNFTMEASNFSDEVTQTFKRQKLPYKVGEQPFKFIETNRPENIESESFLQQYDEAKNTKEHVYQYISRENFTEDSVENYEGENLYDIINQINKESKYFRANFLKTGTNSLLNDFTQYKPNGFIHRMGLLTSEIYHTLGVVPTYSYMNDKLFRWAPSPSGQKIFHDRDIDEIDKISPLLNLYPKPKSMRWGENVWAGKGFIVYKKPTEKYKSTEEFKENFKNNIESLKEVIASFDEIRDANKFVEEMEYFDEEIRNYQQSDIVKYEYEVKESLYETGVFFVNIPLNKIPANFYIPDTKELYNIINRSKPFGVKPIINYIIESEFNLDLEYKMIPNYIKPFEYDFEDLDIKYNICQNKFVEENISCNQTPVKIMAKIPTNCVFYNTDFELSPILNVDYSNVGMNPSYFESNIEQENVEYFEEVDQDFRTTKNITELLYNNNYNNISFKIISTPFGKIPESSDRTFTSQNEVTYINNLTPFLDSVKLPINSKTDLKTLFVEDSFGRIHKLETYYDSSQEMYNIKYIYQNSKGKDFTRKEGFENISGLVIGFIPYNNRKILIFMVEDSEKVLHYFYHTIVEDIIRTNCLTNGENVYEDLMYKTSLFNNIIELETPFCYNIERYSPKIFGGNNWVNLYRLNDDSTSYSYIQNNKKDSITPEPIEMFFDDINIPKTSIIKNIKFNIDGNSSKKSIYLDKCFGENYKISDIEGYSLQLKPSSIDNYPQNNESSAYYQIKLDDAINKEQDTLIEYYTNLINQNQIFNEDLNLKISDYLYDYDKYITISKGFWNELSDFTNLEYHLNETKGIKLIIEGFNEGDEVDVLSQVLLGVDLSSVVKTKVPSGYFYLEIPLLYSNNFLLSLLRVRFRFFALNHNIKIFNTLVDIDFKNKQKDVINYNFAEEFQVNKQSSIKLLEDCIYPKQINNGIELKISFDDIDSGNFYHLSKANLDILYKDTDVNLMINKNKYRYEPIGESQTSISGKISSDAYISGLFYNDIQSVSQIESDVGAENKGIELQDTIFQSFEAREDNITSIEIFPNGFIGNPDETLKIGIYTNHQNTPDKLIKEIYANGWVKNNEELKKLPSIKYNLNVDNLDINETYWIKIQVLNPRDGSYYLLKSISETKPRHRLLYRKNNNYINTFSSLTFIIYSENLSKSFGRLPTVQEFFDNPYILIGLHRGKGTIKDLVINKWISTSKEEEHMKNYLDVTPEMLMSDPNDSEIGITIEEEDGTVLVANFKTGKWDVKEKD